MGPQVGIDGVALGIKKGDAKLAELAEIVLLTTFLDRSIHGMLSYPLIEEGAQRLAVGQGFYEIDGSARSNGKAKVHLPSAVAKVVHIVYHLIVKVGSIGSSHLSQFNRSRAYRPLRSAAHLGHHITTVSIVGHQREGDVFQGAVGFHGISKIHHEIGVQLAGQLVDVHVGLRGADDGLAVYHLISQLQKRLLQGEQGA